MHIHLTVRDDSVVKPAAVVVISIGDCLCGRCQMIKVVDEGVALQEKLQDVRVSPTRGHRQDTCTQPVSSVHVCPILQEDMGDGQVTKSKDAKRHRG